MRITTSNVEYARTQTHVLERCRGIHHSDHTKALKHQIIWCIQDIGPTNCLYKISFRFFVNNLRFFGLNNWSDRSFVYKWCENYPKSPYDTQWTRLSYPRLTRLENGYVHACDTHHRLSLLILCVTAGVYSPA